MGHKVHPYGFRLGVIYPWKSNWYAKRDYAEHLHEDIWIRKHIRSRLTRAGISSIDIERYTKKRVDVKVEDMNQASSEVRPETDATLLAQGVAEQLVGRVAFRRAMRRAVQTAMRSGALGVRVATAGRLGGTEMGRKEWYREGRVPLHTLRAKVDFGTAEARTTMGAIGVKVWVYHGDELEALDSYGLAARVELPAVAPVGATAAVAAAAPTGREMPAAPETPTAPETSAAEAPSESPTEGGEA